MQCVTTSILTGFIPKYGNISQYNFKALTRPYVSCHNVFITQTSETFTTIVDNTTLIITAIELLKIFFDLKRVIDISSLIWLLKSKIFIVNKHFKIIFTHNSSLLGPWHWHSLIKASTTSSLEMVMVSVSTSSQDGCMHRRHCSEFPQLFRSPSTIGSLIAFRSLC